MAAAPAKSTADRIESGPGRAFSRRRSHTRLSGLQRPATLEQPDARLLNLCEVGRLDGGAGDPHHIPPRCDQIPHQAHRFAQPAAHPIPLDRLTETPAHRETASAIRLVVRQQAQHEQRMRVADPCLPYQPESFLFSQPKPALHLNTIFDRGQRGANRRLARTPCGLHQAESRLRPRSRRALMTFCPPGVLIRAKNPCTRLRRRLLG